MSVNSSCGAKIVVFKDSLSVQSFHDASDYAQYSYLNWNNASGSGDSLVSISIVITNLYSYSGTVEAVLDSDGSTLDNASYTCDNGGGTVTASLSFQLPQGEATAVEFNVYDNDGSLVDTIISTIIIESGQTSVSGSYYAEPPLSDPNVSMTYDEWVETLVPVWGDRVSGSSGSYVISDYVDNVQYVSHKEDGVWKIHGMAVIYGSWIHTLYYDEDDDSSTYDDESPLTQQQVHEAVEGSLKDVGTKDFFDGMLEYDGGDLTFGETDWDTGAINTNSTVVADGSDKVSFVENWFGHFFQLDVPVSLAKREVITVSLPAAGNSPVAVLPESITLDLGQFSNVELVRFIQACVLHVSCVFICARIFKAAW